MGEHHTQRHTHSEKGLVTTEAETGVTRLQAMELSRPDCDWSH